MIQLSPRIIFVKSSWAEKQTGENIRTANQTRNILTLQGVSRNLTLDESFERLSPHSKFIIFKAYFRRKLFYKQRDNILKSFSETLGYFKKFCCFIKKL